MPTEQEAIANLTEGEDRWLQLWSSHVSGLDKKASIIVTLDGILLALTASFLGTALSHSFPLVASTLFGASTVLVLFSAGACTRVAWVPFFSSKRIAEAGSIGGAYTHMLKSRSRKTGFLHLAVILLLGALTGYVATILILLAQMWSTPFRSRFISESLTRCLSASGPGARPWLRMERNGEDDRTIRGFYRRVVDRSFGISTCLEAFESCLKILK